MMSAESSTTDLVAVIEANLCAVWSSFACVSGAELHDGPDALWTLTDVPFALLNAVHRARLEPPQVDATIELVIARARTRGVPLVWLTSPATRPADLGGILEAHGFLRGDEMLGMAIDLAQLGAEPAAVPGLVVREVRDEAELQTWCVTATAAFEYPPFVAEFFERWLQSLSPARRASLALYLGWLDGEPVAGSQLIPGAGVAGIYTVGTLAAARGRGIGSALTWRALLEGRARGYQVGVLAAEVPGVGLYRRLGLRECCTIGCYLWSPKTGADAT
jgi:ribosomal protein S18 acetylase RimI-like enzyme